jgi:hypothetical protein
MAQENHNSLAALETQLDLSRKLKLKIAEARAAYAAWDLDAIYRHIGAQAVLCLHLQNSSEAMRLGHEPPAVPGGGDAMQGATQSDARNDARARELLAELAAVQREIRELNSEQTIVVEGWRRTLHMMGNALATFSPTYNRPPARPFPAPARPSL